MAPVREQCLVALPYPCWQVPQVHPRGALVAMPMPCMPIQALQAMQAMQLTMMNAGRGPRNEVSHGPQGPAMEEFGGSRKAPPMMPTKATMPSNYDDDHDMPPVPDMKVPSLDGRNLERDTSGSAGSNSSVGDGSHYPSYKGYKGKRPKGKNKPKGKGKAKVDNMKSPGIAGCPAEILQANAPASQIDLDVVVSYPNVDSGDLTPRADQGDKVHLREYLIQQYGGNRGSGQDCFNSAMENMMRWYQPSVLEKKMTPPPDTENKKHSPSAETQSKKFETYHECDMVLEFLDNGTEEQCRQAAAWIRSGDILKLSQNSYSGSRIVQKVLDYAEGAEGPEIAQAFHGKVWECLQGEKGEHANFVLQKIVEVLQPADFAFIVSELSDPNPNPFQKDPKKNRDAKVPVRSHRTLHSNVKSEGVKGEGTWQSNKGEGYVNAARLRYGCRLLERLIEHCPNVMVEPNAQGSPILSIAPAIDKLITSCRYAGDHDHKMQSDAGLMQHAYGNYVIAHILEHGTPEQCEQIVAQVVKDFDHLAKHRIGSHVIEKAVTLAEVSLKEHSMINERENAYRARSNQCAAPNCWPWPANQPTASFSNAYDMKPIFDERDVPPAAPGEPRLLPPKKERPRLSLEMIEQLRLNFIKLVKVDEPSGHFHGCRFENFIELALHRYGVLVVKKFLEHKEFSRGGQQACQQCNMALYHPMFRLNYVDAQPRLCLCCSPVCCRLFDSGSKEQPGPLQRLRDKSHSGFRFSSELLETLETHHRQGKNYHVFEEEKAEPVPIENNSLGRQQSHESEYSCGSPADQLYCLPAWNTGVTGGM
eukprot:gnl/MRDRNA2_/MRDRNA2_65384_c1_seq1.p1 gnl/MRDRNA2_/MRDRNA2_65384_c1~~gnl/MRDRNA2_/MRDRNA2_65384_c1_seq1.p1  ORF type:complete len:857 (-),score=149.78 gnl/MRDRNA2_/MRDRNA2_65384_c1_seq1:16-2463(-)